MNHIETLILHTLGAQVMTFRELKAVLRLPETDLHHALDHLLDRGAIQADPRTADESEYKKT